MDANEKRKQIEIEILKIIKEKLEEGEMNTHRAGEIARLVLKILHPGISLDEIYRVVPTLDDHFSELSKAVVPIMKEYEDKIESVVKDKVAALIKEGKFTEATKLAQNTIDQTKGNKK